MAVRERRRLLITGTAGCGKRSLGNLLADTRAFVHVDLDRRDASGLNAEHAWAELAPELEAAFDAVVTWTPASADDLGLIELLQAKGFHWAWLDCDHGAAFPAMFATANSPARPRLIAAFEPDGTFRPLERVVAELLESAPALVPARPPRARTLAHSD